MKKLLFFTMLAFIALSCQHSHEDHGSATDQNHVIGKAKDGVFIHITSGYDNPHRVLMPMKMATMMAKDKDVLVYMDIDAVELATEDAKELTHAGFDSFRVYLNKLIEMGVGVYVCPTCLKIGGYIESDLVEGVKLAEKDKFFNFTEGRIITLDY